ncbi:putative bifunctional diguanylate cyclase/phosphodiesterase [Lysobacter silvisoli]|uniref:EAL domain-containing protein n=1 Tax=Lysobacter silvisoli TaxID=2293254 RepID=A0A371JYH4_9GAMM|nr:EAL domain-containing protein [Lysobacter silvisoli]RDZ26716.1 EAL domain-containing protein [Lysobacter silvisoli]
MQHRDVAAARSANWYATPGSKKAPWRVWLGFVALVFAAGLATVISAAVIEIQAGATAYLVGEGHWSRARLEIVYHLDRYAARGDPRELALARKALEVPMGDRAGRLALERSPPDLQAAAQGFRAGRNAEADIPRLIWVYRNFSKAPFFADAVAIWREAEPHIFRLQAIADQLEAHWRQPGAGAAGPQVRAELDRIGRTLQPMERRFADTLLDGVAQVRVMLLLVSGVLFVVIAALAVLAYYSSLRRIRATESRFRAAFQQASVGMVKLNTDGLVLAANEELAAMLGHSAEYLVGTRFSDHLNDGGAADDSWMNATAPVEHRVRRADGSQFWGRITTSNVQVEHGDGRIFLIVEDVSEARDLTQILTFQASHDGLTGLINRREIEQRLDGLLAQAHADGRRHTLCFLDLDQFKLINDTCSHAAGDEVLRLIATTLPGHLRPQDWMGRLGGDEFAVLLHDTPVDAATALAGRMNQILADTCLLWEGHHFALTASIGLVEINAESPTVAWLLRAADTACYLAKDGGRNSIQVYAESDAEVAQRHREMHWIDQTRSAIAEDRLQLYAQRIVPLDPAAGGLQYEILVRLRDHNGNLCQPGAFLPAAERYGQASMIDLQVLTLTVQALSRNRAHLNQLELCHVNVSGQSAASRDFCRRAEALLTANPEVARKLCFELTETASIDRLSQARAFIETVHAHGCLVALDDFGSGLSSFAYLKSLPVDILKIDGLFVRDIDRNDLDYAVVRAITEVARSQGKRTVAEWAETPAVLQRLRDIGVDAAQGYAIHEPCPLQELIRQVGPAAPTSHVA